MRPDSSATPPTEQLFAFEELPPTEDGDEPPVPCSVPYNYFNARGCTFLTRLLGRQQTHVF
jgi:hypothetical protein